MIASELRPGCNAFIDGPQDSVINRSNLKGGIFNLQNQNEAEKKAKKWATNILFQSCRGLSRKN